MWIGMCQVPWGIYYCRKKGFLFLRACWVTSVMSDYLWPCGFVACQASLSMGFSGQEYWCGLPCPSPKASVLAWLYFYYICVYLKGRWDSPGKSTGVGCHAPLQGIFPTQGLNPGLPHCWQSLYHLSHWGSSGILEWASYPFSRGSSWARNPTGVSCIAGGFFINWAIREAHSSK